MSMSPETGDRFGRVLFLIYAVISLTAWTYVAIFVVGPSSHFLLRLLLVFSMAHLLLGLLAAAVKLIAGER